VEAGKRVKEVEEIYAKVREKIERSNTSYQAYANKCRRTIVFLLRDLVWVNLMKERFPQKRKSKLSLWVGGPFEVLERINDNAYKP